MIIYNFGQSSLEFPAVLQTISLAVVTIFIPVAIFLFDKNDDKEFKLLDRALVLDHLVGAKDLLWKLGLIFIPLLFWDIDSYSTRSLIFILWAAGIYLILQVMIRSYNWMRKSRFEFRFDYLASLEPDDDLEDLWRSVWESSAINASNEQRFFKIFTGQIDNLFGMGENKRSLELLPKLLNDFQIFMKKRSVIFITAPDDVFKKVLEWHFIAWQHEYEHLAKEDHADHYVEYMQLSQILDSFIRSITERALTENYPFGLFQLLKTHSEKHKDNSIQGPKFVHHYLESLLDVFYNSFLKNISGVPSHFEVWDFFPKEWLATKNNLVNQENMASRVTLKEFFEWAQDRIWKPGERDYDIALDSVSKELFPTTEPHFWAFVVTFLVRPWGGDGRMKSMVENPLSFGLMGRIHGGVYNMGQDVEKIFANLREEEAKNTAELACIIAPGEFSEQKVTVHIQELESLVSYAPDSKEEANRRQYLEYMKQILEFLKNKRQN